MVRTWLPHYTIWNLVTCNVIFIQSLRRVCALSKQALVSASSPRLHSLLTYNCFQCLSVHTTKNFFQHPLDKIYYIIINDNNEEKRRIILTCSGSKFVAFVCLNQLYSIPLAKMASDESSLYKEFNKQTCS